MGDKAKTGSVVNLGVGGTKLISDYVVKVFPMVDEQLNQWTCQISKIGDEVLRKQGLLSITNKRFHAQGGSVYSLYPGVNRNETVRFIVAFQTISDYLDNLCDRAGVMDATAFSELHKSMLDAVDPGESAHEYYGSYPHKDDHGYLPSLVEECKQQIRSLPSYGIVAEPIRKYVQLYSYLQTYKHLRLEIRESSLKQWAEAQLKYYPDIYWWEFSAAAGSTLAIFLLFSAAYNPELTPGEVTAIEKAYFPWVCGLHILLDYYIDLDEDKATGDLNFVDYYKDHEQSEERLVLFIRNAISKSSVLRYPDFHHTVIRGLLAMYLSDPKARERRKKLINRKLISAGGERTNLYHLACGLLRRTGLL